MVESAEKVSRVPVVLEKKSLLRHLEIVGLLGHLED
jgi:hypothetical protein